MWTALVLLTVLLAGCGLMAWAVRGRRCTWLAPSIWRGPDARRAIALSFDDGPSESTARVLDLLEQYGAKATFFMCGHHVRRLPFAACQVMRQGHEIGNHSETHEPLYLRSPGFIQAQLGRAQESIQEVTGVTPRLFRPPFGARWFGLRAAQRKLGLQGVIWTEIARDWALDGPAVAERLRDKARSGAILCFHDGRELRHNPDIGSTLGALELLLPHWAAQGFEFVTVSELLWNKTNN